MGEINAKEAAAAKSEISRCISIPPWEVHVSNALAADILRLDLSRVKSLAELCAGQGNRHRGRSETAILELPGSDIRVHIRPFRHGGVLARVTGARLRGLDRPLAELLVGEQLWRRGIPVARPAFVMGRKRCAFWEAAVASVYEEESSDGVAYLGEEPEEGELRAVARAAGRAVRRLHDAGCRHADLHIKNLLVCRHSGGDDPHVVIIDLDAARLLEELSPHRRMRELMRLYRSLLKRNLATASRPRICATFFSAYLAGDRGLRSALLAHRGREQLRVAVHSLLYRSTR